LGRTHVEGAQQLRLQGGHEALHLRAVTVTATVTVTVTVAIAVAVSRTAGVVAVGCWSSSWAVERLS
jgi:hypothetical protein